jgi:hypothetical protein
MRTIRATRSGQVLGRPRASSAAPTNETTDSRKSQRVLATSLFLDPVAQVRDADALDDHDGSFELHRRGVELGE